MIITFHRIKDSLSSLKLKNFATFESKVRIINSPNTREIDKSKTIQVKL